MGTLERHLKEWGYEDWIVNTDKYCGKILFVKKQYRCSIHYHKLKDETFYIQSGKVYLELNNEVIIMNQGNFKRIFPGQKHRFSGLEDSIIFEFSTPHSESDSYREKLSGKIPDEEFIKIGGFLKD
jgi:quercetin dioxygenase-like cupin family protein